MNKDTFSKKLHFELNTFDSNYDFITNWYEIILNELENIKDSSLHIKHPRHIGDHLEDSIKKIFEKILPKRFEIGKGFAINSISARSKEVDLIFYDSMQGGVFAKTDSTDYIPIEIISSAMEVKSNLTYTELRKSILNCVSLKKLNFEYFRISEKERFPFYTIFAYSSKTNDKNFLRELNEAIFSIPKELRPNMIYIFNKGLFLPKTKDEVVIDYGSIINNENEFGFISTFNNMKLESSILFFFFTFIIKHLIDQTKFPVSINYIDYLVKQNSVIKYSPKEGHKKPKKFYNSDVLLSDSLDEVIYNGFDKNCPKCNCINPFLFPIVASKQVKDYFLEENKNLRFYDKQNRLERTKCLKCNADLEISKDDYK